MNQNISLIQELLHHTEDLKVKVFQSGQKECSLLYLDSMVDHETMESKVINPLLQSPDGNPLTVINVTELEIVHLLNKAVLGLIEGNAILLREHDSLIYLIMCPFSSPRSIKEPISEQVIRGSHEGFIEDLNTNIFLVRKQIKNPNLTVQYMTIGESTKTKVAILHIENLANEEIVKEVKKRISYIHSDYIQAPGHLEEFIEDNPFSPFPQLLNTERPDRVASQLMDGRVAVLVDGSPSVLVMPVSFFSFYQTPDDYNTRWYIGSFFRFLRFISFIITISLPAVYIAVVSFHYEIIPIDLLFSLKSSLEYVPFPPIIEAMMMQVTLELLREASIRLPSPIAQTIGVVGGLVIGTAVVEANLVSNTMIIVVAVTAISSFVVPVSEMGTSVRLLGFPLMIASATFGFIGISFVFMVILIHLCKLETFGSPYFAPFAPLRIRDLQDTIVRLPLWLMNKRSREPKPKKLQKEYDSRGWKKDEE
ncbi:spore germination protein [Ammoniphilus resinae]|uniref:Spore germination protein KA n=1 Tax=Ammoniphilus resinae TaxID=861532 RepID=A0ABS4GNK6_9BACL|nr:spore germination protein [Ammoniphilus resinae]MBP1931859.1 spore germination protein KA [Ammoniphilus resinae]